MSRVFAFALLIAAGCSPGAEPPATSLTPPSARPAVPPEQEEWPTEEQLRARAEPLPPAPKLDPANAHKPLLPDGSLLLETATLGGKPKPIRLLVRAEVCLRKGPLELFLCRTRSKEHEAIVRSGVEPRLLHAGLLALGLAPGSPVQYVDPKTREEAYRPASGPAVRVTLHYKLNGKSETKPAQQWVLDRKANKPMAQDWVFAGSTFYQDPDDPEQPPYYMANNGDVISLSNFPSAMLDLPVQSTQDNEQLGYEALTDAIPPLYSGVWVILDGKPKP